MNYDPSTVKGFQDFLPPESTKRAAIKKIIEKHFVRYGFLPVETPVIEYDELMRSDALPKEGEDQAVSDRFRLQDRGARNLGLRYEFTFQLSRILKQNPNLKMPFKRFQIGEVFRDEPIGMNRFRQFTQCDADIIGDATMDADAECLSLFSDILTELKIESTIHVNNRKLLTAIIESVEIPEVKGVMRELDKMDKLDLDQIKTNLRAFASTNQIVTLLKLLEKDLAFFKENAFPGVEEIEELMERCKQYGVLIKYNPYLIRGLGYYTGNIFEIKASDNHTIAGGGRYDKTVGKYLGKEIPAVGIAFGLERVVSLAQIDIDPSPVALLISLSQDQETINFAKELRAANISCMIQFGKVGKAMEYADAYAIPNVIFIGEEEIGKKKYKMRNMITGKESFLTGPQLIKSLEK